jgi:hypothetical protein
MKFIFLAPMEGGETLAHLVEALNYKTEGRSWARLPLEAFSYSFWPPFLGDKVGWRVD